MANSSIVIFITRFGQPVNRKEIFVLEVFKAEELLPFIRKVYEYLHSLNVEKIIQ